jgi:DNA-binding NtrC family response regulator
MGRHRKTIEGEREAETLAELLEATGLPGSSAWLRADQSFEVRVGTTLAEVEHSLINHTLNACKGNKRRAARTLGVCLRTLYNRLAHYHIAN